MKREDFDKFAAALGGIAELYGKPVSEVAQRIWWEALKQFDIKDVERAMIAAIKSPDTGQFMPRPADIIRMIEGTTGDRALLAWSRVQDTMRSVGAYNSVAFDDPAIHAAVESMGGWPKLCREKVEELPFLQKRFCDLHRAHTLSPESRPIAYLPGEYEQTNAMSGRPTAKPVLIGDPTKAAALIQLGAEKRKVISMVESIGGGS